MNNGYEKAAKEVIPAVRLAIITELASKYHITEEDIAGYLEIAQAAVSKYLNGKYSEKVKALEEKIDKRIVELYSSKISEGKKEAVNLCMCTICNALNAFDCQFSYTKKA